MLNDKIKGEWRSKVKSIFTEAQKKFEEQEEENTGLDLGSDTAEDPAVASDAAPVDGAVDPEAGAGEVEEEEPTIVLTASLLKSLLDYCSAPDEEVEVDAEPVDPEGDVPPAPVAEVSAGNPSMTAPAMTTNTGVMENVEVPAEPEAPVVDDALDADGDVEGDLPVDGDVSGDQVSSDEIVQRLIDLSADAGGEPLDVDVLAVVFSPEGDEGDEGEDLGGDDLEGNVELPATTGDQTVPPTAPAPVPPAV